MNEEFISGRQAARMIGVHYNTFYHWVEKGKIPFVNTATTKKYRVVDINRWIERNENNQPPGNADLFVTTADIPRTPLIHLADSYLVECSVVWGWELMRVNIGERVTIATEHSQETYGWLVLDVSGFVICDSRTKSVLLSSTQAEGPTS